MNTDPLSKIPGKPPMAAMRRMWSEKSGAVAIIFGLALIPLVLMLGVTVDYSRAAWIKSRLQNAADAAVLAAGSQGAQTQAQHVTLAAATIATNLGTSLASGGCGATSCALTATKSLGNITVTETESVGTYQVQITGNIAMTMMQLANFSSIPITVSSQAQTIGVGSAHPLEIALALDNTGSMANNIQALRTAAQTLADTAMAAAGTTGAVRVSVVPYVAAVNPGLPNLNYIDTTAQSWMYNGRWFAGSWIAYNTGCVGNWGSGSGGSSSGPGGSSSGDAGDARDIEEILNPIRHLAQELFGVSSAHANSINLGVTPNTIPPITTSTLTSLKLKNGTHLKTYKLPAGFGDYLTTMSGSSSAGYDGGGCDWLANPGTVSHYDLFPRVLNTSGQSVAWKGCVEARPTKTEQAWVNSNWGSTLAATTDYDVTDTAPSSSDALSLFVPYFWPDEPDYNMITWAYQAPGLYVNGSGGFHNNYLNDATYASGSTTATLPSAWGWTLNGAWSAGQYILKYDGTTNAAAINESGITTAGPNAGCPDPVLPLTNVRSTVDTKIQNLTYWYNGGTVISEGFMWAWRTLSPTTNFWNLATPPAAYNSSSTKVIVLMTDGVNGLADNGNSSSSGSSSANISDYSAYGYLGGFRLGSINGINQYGPVTTPTSPPTDLTTYLDDRLLAACANAKKQGITVYTVLFSANISQALATHSQSILSQCASTPSGAFQASDASGLNTAFGNIATSATAQPLHLTR